MTQDSQLIYEAYKTVRENMPYPVFAKLSKHASPGNKYKAKKEEEKDKNTDKEKDEDEQTPYDLGKGFEENDALNRVMADFGVDQKNKTKIIEFLISMSKQGQGQAPGATAAKPPTPPAVQKAFITNLSGQTK